jgi:disulfide bond formation protein DsbB
MLKKIFSFFFENNFRLLILFSLMSIFPLVIVYIMQYGFDIEPCKLCIYQRIPFFLIAVLPIFFIPFKKKSIYGLFIVLLAILSNVALSFVHLGIENKWFENKLCTGAIPHNGNFESLFLSANTYFHKCDEVKFRFLNISLTGWDLIYCLFFFIFVNAMIIIHFFKKKN